MEKNRFRRALNQLRRLDEMLLSVLFPPRCPVCDELTCGTGKIHAECRKQIVEIREPLCKCCGQPMEKEEEEYCYDCGKKSHAIVQNRAFCLYKGKMADSLYRFKFKNKREYAQTYAALWHENHGEWLKRCNIDVIIPVPLSAKRRRRRGYNQAALIARELGRLAEIPVDTGILVRVRDTKSQKSLNQQERKNNMKNAFKTTADIVKLYHVLLVDDIYTTGNTLDAAARALLAGGFHQIYSCTISIGKGY